MKNYSQPYFIEFSKLGENEIGYLSVAQNGNLPFHIKRSFWTYDTPESVIRGRHAHHETEQILIAVTGKIIVTTESADGDVKTFLLDKPEVGLYLPPNVWHTMQYHNSAVQLVLASTEYKTDDYIRDYDLFKKTWSNK